MLHSLGPTELHLPPPHTPATCSRTPAARGPPPARVSFHHHHSHDHDDSTTTPTSSSSKSRSMGAGVAAAVGQRLNLAGVALASRVAVSQRHLALPHVTVRDIRCVDWAALRARGFQGVVLDKDNTITAPYAMAVWPGLVGALEECKAAFPGAVALLSNSAGLRQFDPDGAEARKLESALDVPVIRHETKKPAGSADDVASFFGCPPALLVMVGDRYFTDVVYGNRNGLLTIRPAPLTLQGEPFIVQQVRKVEESLVQRWERSGVTPTRHILFTHADHFIKPS